MPRQSLYCIIKSASLINVQMDGQMRVPRRRCGVVAVNSRPVPNSARASPGKARDRPLRPSPYYYYARRRLVADTRIANTSPDRIDGFLKVTPGAIRNIARGLSLHFRTVNIRSIVVESGALIENTRGVSQGEAPSRYRLAVPGNTAPRASNIARDDIINARRSRMFNRQFHRVALATRYFRAISASASSAATKRRERQAWRRRLPDESTSAPRDDHSSEIFRSRERYCARFFRTMQKYGRSTVNGLPS